MYVCVCVCVCGYIGNIVKEINKMCLSQTDF